MIRNVGFTDKLIRITISITLIVFAALFNIWWLLLVAVIPFITAFAGFCPLYAPFKINTNKETAHKTKKEKTGKSNSKNKKSKRK